MRNKLFSVVKCFSLLFGLTYSSISVAKEDWDYCMSAMHNNMEILQVNVGAAEFSSSDKYILFYARYPNGGDASWYETAGSTDDGVGNAMLAILTEAQMFHHKIDFNCSSNQVSSIYYPSGSEVK